MRLRWIAIVLIVGMFVGYLVRFRLPLEEERKSMLQAQEETLKNLEQEKKRLVQEKSDLMTKYPMLIFNYQEQNEEFGRVIGEAVGALPVQNVLLQNVSATQIEEVEKQIKAAELALKKESILKKGKDQGKKKETTNLLKAHEARLSQIRNNIQASGHLFTLDFVLDSHALSDCIHFLEHLTYYGRLATVKLQVSDDASDSTKLLVSVQYQTKPAQFLSLYKPYQVEPKESLVALNRFTTPSHEERRLKPEDASHLEVTQILYNPASQEHSFAIISGRLMVSVGDEVDGIFVKKIEPEQVVFGYYSEVTLAVSKK
jgi:uncharacterized membrane-anchored protein YhcB (DUF1043 family)